MVASDVWHYDNGFEPDELFPDGWWVERIYCFRFDAFTEADWTALDAVYQELPGWLGYGEDGCPCWFGVNEDASPYLWASVEPPGLQVHGVLPLATWERWDTHFRTATRTLPHRPHPK